MEVVVIMVRVVKVEVVVIMLGVDVGEVEVVVIMVGEVVEMIMVEKIMVEVVEVVVIMVWVVVVKLASSCTNRVCITARRGSQPSLLPCLLLTNYKFTSFNVSGQTPRPVQLKG